MAAGRVVGVAAVAPVAGAGGGGLLGPEATGGTGLGAVPQAAMMAAMVAAPAARHVRGDFGALFIGCLPKTNGLIHALQCWQQRRRLLCPKTGGLSHILVSKGNDDL